MSATPDPTAMRAEFEKADNFGLTPGGPSKEFQLDWNARYAAAAHGMPEPRLVLGAEWRAAAKEGRWKQWQADAQVQADKEARAAERRRIAAGPLAPLVPAPEHAADYAAKQAANNQRASDEIFRMYGVHLPD